MKEGVTDLTEGHTPIQPYIDGSSVSTFGSSNAFPSGEASGTINITTLTDSHVCGTIDLTAYHGGVVKGDFSCALGD